MTNSGNRADRRATRSIIRGAAAKLSGRTRGPDWRGDKRRTPRADSVDVDDPKANVWRPIGDGTRAGGLVFVDAVLGLAQSHNLFERTRNDAERRALGLRTSAEVAAYNAAEQARFEAERDAWQHARDRGRYVPKPRQPHQLHPPGWQGPLGQHTLRVLEALLRGARWCCFRTGRIDPALSQLVTATGFAKQTIVTSLKRLKAMGLIHWVRRTVQLTEDDGDRRRVQTNNAYYFDLGALSSRLRMHLEQLLARRRRQGGTEPPPTHEPDAPPSGPRLPQDPALRAIVERLGASTLDLSPA